MEWLADGRLRLDPNYLEIMIATLAPRRPFTAAALAKRIARLLPGGVPKMIRAYDNGGKTFDRYTVVFTGRYRDRKGCEYLGMSEHPFNPQGFGQHGEADQPIDYPTYSHIGKKISFAQLPSDCRKLVLSDYRSIWRLDEGSMA
jgi:hypothetical protein